MKIQEKFDKAKTIADRFFAMGAGSLFVDLGIYEGDSAIRICYFPPECAFEDSVRYAMSIVGKMEKEGNGNMSEEKDGGPAWPQTRKRFEGAEDCPFCGDWPEHCDGQENYKTVHWLQCQHCEARSGTFLDKSEAISAWNRRP